MPLLLNKFNESKQSYIIAFKCCVKINKIKESEYVLRGIYLLYGTIIVFVTKKGFIENLYPETVYKFLQMSKKY